ncbi:hypothetical protein KEM60_02618 [Austwickia sp. TVS 96-490-7B]|uniref:bifunctional adenosylcobinamide kinase/adenosylcobinamide-phosphate guanylyltransferase n=1 Tax=Austwickia sp. TVS 96-490-7B TaxID=2830843 RepID=UPI001C587ECE|nr:bifunctional adenosylcobinamide kinase/adenosylcobinamide-phosphate guanylyltransferase [Austwickia sp. TVS 96-490-7B]MBW3086400.1 hypothetical protein [Austwickia sp. TVS 96-490-7B]
MTSVLIVGGVRSGKSAYAEKIMAGAPADPGVAYVAPGPVPDPVQDPEWAARVAVHQKRRPEHWTTIETADVPGAVASTDRPMLVDCLGTWVTRLVDDSGTWSERDRARTVVQSAADRLCLALRAAPAPVVLVSNEVGLGVVPDHPSGRLFRDLLGMVNVAVSTECTHVLWVVAGRVLDLSTAPTITGPPRPDLFAASGTEAKTAGRPGTESTLRPRPTSEDELSQRPGSARTAV